MTLQNYITKNATPCNPEEGQNLVFFSVKAAEGATLEGLKEAIASHKGEFCELNPLDGEEHTYIELGGWIGDQGLALQFIGLGAALGAWKLLTPFTMLGDIVDEGLARVMAGQGFVSLQVSGDVNVEAGKGL